MNISFEEALLIIGLLLVVAAALSGWLHGTVLSISVLSVVSGLMLSWIGVIEVEASSELVLLTVELALILTLFADGLLVEDELLRHAWRPPARALVIAMPLTGGMIAVAAKLIFSDLSWSEALLLGAVLSPTDPVITSAVVTAQRVPSLIRHTLNLESGLNDGLALPFVLFFLVLASDVGDPAAEGAQLLGEAGFGAILGVGLAFLAGWLLARLPGGITEKYEGIYAFGLAFLAFGMAEVTFGNGLIAVFVAGIALAVARHDIPTAFREFNESVSATFQVITFFLFGALIVGTGWDGSWLRLLVFIGFALLVARPVAVLVSFAGIRMPRSYKLFIAWFGPKGVASMLFALFVLGSATPDRTLVFDAASFVVLASILAHGLTDTFGANWIQAHLGRQRSVTGDDDGVGERIQGRKDDRAAPVVNPPHR